MTIGPEVIIGAVACVVYSISAVACLFANKRDGINFCSRGQPNPAYPGEPVLDFEEITMMEAARIEQLDAYIQRQSGQLPDEYSSDFSRRLKRPQQRQLTIAPGLERDEH